MTLQGPTGVDIVSQGCLAQGDVAPHPGQGIDLHFLGEAVFAPVDLFGYLLPLPGKPVGNVVKFRFAFGCLQVAILLPQPALAACVAENLGTLGVHMEFLAAVGALVQDLVQTLGPERFRDKDAVVLLVLILVVGQGLTQGFVDLLDGHFFDLLRIQNLGEHRVHGNLPLMAEIPERGIQVIAVVNHRHHRHLIHFDQLTQGIRQEGQGTAGGIPGLGIHGQNIAPFQHMADGFHQMDVGGEFPGGDGADPLQQEPFNHIAVDADHIGYGMGPGGHGCQLKIDEVHVVAQQHVGGRNTLHIHLFHLIFLADQGEPGQNPNQTGPEFGLVQGVPGCLVPFFILIINFNVHKLKSLLPQNCK